MGSAQPADSKGHHKSHQALSSKALSSSLEPWTETELKMGCSQDAAIMVGS